MMYDWDGDEDWNISDEILSEKSNALEPEIKPIYNIPTQSSPYNIKFMDFKNYFLMLKMQTLNMHIFNFRL